MSNPFEGKDHIKEENWVRDKDLNWSSPHHSLGGGPTQAAPGNHKHTTKDITDYKPDSGGGSGEGGVTDHGALTGLTPDDDHPQYLTKARGDGFYSLLTHNHNTLYDPINAAANGDIAHVNASNPHSQYSQTGHTHPYDPAGTAAAGDTAHAVAADPHTVYLKPSEVLAGTNVTVDTVSVPGSVKINSTASGGGVTDHGALTGLADDDHPQYLRRASLTQVAPVAIDWNDIIEPGPYLQLLHGTNNPNGPGTVIYYYLTNYVYGTQVTQYAIPYSQTVLYGVQIRSLYQDTWTAWSDTKDSSNSYVRAGTARQYSRAIDSIANNVSTSLTGGWAAGTGDAGNGGPLVYSGGIITVGESGFYDVTVYINWQAGTAAGLRRIDLLLNGVAYLRDDSTPATPTGTCAHIATIAGMYIVAGQTLQVAVMQQSGAALNINNGKWYTRKVASQPQP